MMYLQLASLGLPSSACPAPIHPPIFFPRAGKLSIVFSRQSELHAPPNRHLRNQLGLLAAFLSRVETDTSG